MGLVLLGLIVWDPLIIILITPLLFLLFVGVISFYSQDLNIDVHRMVSQSRIFVDDTVQVTLRLHNKGETLRFLEIYDSLPSKVSIQKGSNYSVLTIEKNEEITLTYEIICPIRGHFQIGPLNLRVHDFLGMFSQKIVLNPISELTIIPHMEKIDNIAVRAKANVYPGLMQARHAGIGTEFFGVRSYTAGDIFKQINWKSSARWNRLMVNEFEQESTTDVILILDARECQGIGTIKHSPMEFSIKAAAAIASYFLKRRDRVGLIIYGNADEALKWVYPESGKKQLYKTIKELVEVEPRGDFSFTAVIDTAVTHLLPKRSVIILISSLEGDPSIPKAVEQLRARKFNVIVLSPSPLAIEYSLQATDPYYKLAYRILAMKRKNFLDLLRKCGAQIVDWNPTLPLAVSLKEVERSRGRF